MCKKVFIYSKDNPLILLLKIFSYSDIAKYFNCNIMIISKYIKDGNLFISQ